MELVEHGTRVLEDRFEREVRVIFQETRGLIHIELVAHY
jgi:hypothetical protein